MYFRFFKGQWQPLRTCLCHPDIRLNILRRKLCFSDLSIWLKPGVCQSYQVSPVSKVIIEKSRGGRFLWNKYWDLGWIWAGWHCWKKGFGLIMSNFWGWFKLSSGAKKNIFFQKHCNIRNKKLHKIKLKKQFCFLKGQIISKGLFGILGFFQKTNEFVFSTVRQK